MIVNEGGVITERYPNHFIFTSVVRSEEIPLFHYYPNHRFLAVGTAGCNFLCTGCIARVLPKYPELFDALLRKRRVEDIVKEAIRKKCIGVAFILNEPAVSIMTVLRLAEAVKDAGLLFGISSNMYFTKEALKSLLPYLDFICAGVKGRFTRTYLRFCGGGNPEYVFRNVRIAYEAGVHVEVITPYMKGLERDLIGVAEEIASISKDIPMMVSAFQALTENLLRYEPSVTEAVAICERLEDILNYVYLINVHGTKYLDTRLRDGTVVIKREFYGPCATRIVWVAEDDMAWGGGGEGFGEYVVPHPITAR